MPLRHASEHATCDSYAIAPRSLLTKSAHTLVRVASFRMLPRQAHEVKLARNALGATPSRVNSLHVFV